MQARSLFRRARLLSLRPQCAQTGRRSIVTVEPADAAAPINMAFSVDTEKGVDGRAYNRPGPPIVCLHGLFGSKNNFKTVSKKLNELGNAVYTCDQRNHGDSVHRKVHDYVSMAGDVAHLIDHHLKVKQVTLLGHSMGAKTAMATALLYPEKVANLIIVDNAPVEAQLDSKFAKYARAMMDIENLRFIKRKDADDYLAKTEPDENIRSFLMANIKPAFKNQPNLIFRCNVENIAKHLDHIGGFPFHPDKVRFEKPTLFIRGTRSPYVPDETIPVIGQFFPRFRMADVEAGHWLISENMPEFLRIATEFLEGENERIVAEWGERTKEKRRLKEEAKAERAAMKQAKQEAKLAARREAWEKSNA